MNLHNLIERFRRTAAKRNFQRILRRLENMSYADKYVEPGYSLGENSQGILFGNWNHWGRYKGGQYVLDDESKMMSRIVHILEKVADLEWHDEWTTCSDCGGSVRTQRDCYGWQPAYVLLDCELICLDCCAEHVDEVLEHFDGKDGRALSSSLKIDPAQHGYKLAQKDFEMAGTAGRMPTPR